MGCSEGRPVNSSSNFHSQILLTTNIIYQSNIITQLVDLKLNKIWNEARMQSKTDRKGNLHVQQNECQPTIFQSDKFLAVCAWRVFKFDPNSSFLTHSTINRAKYYRPFSKYSPVFKTHFLQHSEDSVLLFKINVSADVTTPRKNFLPPHSNLNFLLLKCLFNSINGWKSYGKKPDL